MSLTRQVRAEILDTLAPDDPLAIASRADLRLVNRLMSSQVHLGRPLLKILRDRSAVRVVELGAGDGQTLLPIARRCPRGGPRISLELVDLQPTASAATLAAYAAAGWDTSVVRADVFDWLAQAGKEAGVVIVANLFIHHFDAQQLTALLQGIAARADAFLCLEPRRARFALAASHSLGALGCNRVTRHDAVASVHAGFVGEELSAIWPSGGSWQLHEEPAGLFSHRFQALAS